MNTNAHKISLSLDSITKLNGLASEFGCLATTGRTAGQPSWRVLIKEIVTGRISLHDELAYAREQREKEKQQRELKGGDQ